jgi:phosphoribosylpyrophosphate synthetase
MARFANTLKKYPEKFEIPGEPIKWDLFSDGTDKIDIENSEQVAGKKVLFLANTESNSHFIAQLHVLNYLGCLRPGSLTIVLPFLTTGTMERIDSKEKDRVPTAFTTINMFNNLPQMGPPTLIVTYDIHALQVQFYFHHPAVAGLRSAIPLLLKNLAKDITCVAFPDDGANKRFANLFPVEWEKIVCTKIRGSTTLQWQCSPARRAKFHARAHDSGARAIIVHAPAIHRRAIIRTSSGPTSGRQTSRQIFSSKLTR